MKMNKKKRKGKMKIVEEQDNDVEDQNLAERLQQMEVNSHKEDEKCENPGQFYHLNSGKFDGTQKETSVQENNMSMFARLFLEKMESAVCSVTKLINLPPKPFLMRSHGMQNFCSSSRQTPFQCPSTLSTNSDNDLVKRYDEGACSGSDSLYQSKEDLAEESLRMKNSLQVQPSCDRRRHNTVVLVNEDESEIAVAGHQQTEAVDECKKDITIFYPSEDDAESVEIRYSYLDCLASEAWLTSNIINFYIRYLQQNLYSTREDGEDYHFFNTYFYEILRKDALKKKSDMEASFTKIRRWWKGVKLFEKAYIFLPINENFHWSLVIICIPDKEDGGGPTVLHLDSLRLHSSKLIFANIRRFLIGEWGFLRKDVDLLDPPFLENTWKHFPQRINARAIQVPQQRNAYDCGLFVLSFIEQFIEKSSRRMKKEDLAVLNKQWFKPVQASSLREKILHLLKDEFNKEKEENCL